MLFCKALKAIQRFDQFVLCPLIRKRIANVFSGQRLLIKLVNHFFYKYLKLAICLINKQENKNKRKLMSMENHFHTIKQFPNPQTSILHTQDKQTEKKTFISKSNRFQFKALQTPGPGAYEGIPRQKHTHDYHVPREKLQHDVISKEYQWILQNRRVPYALGSIYSSTLGPGTYEIKGIGSNKIGSSNSSWNKQNRFNYNRDREVNKIGPGSYEYDSPKAISKTVGLSVFKSKSPKSFLQTLIKEKSEANQKVKSEEDIVDPDLLDVKDILDKSSPQKLKSKPHSIFASKSQRKSLIHQGSAEHLGPGTYNLTQNPQVSPKIKKKLKPSGKLQSFAIKDIYDRKEIKLEESPGPGHYNYNLDLIESQILKKKGLIGMISKCNRFQNPKSEKQLPGPGQYMQNRFIFLDEGGYRKSKHRTSLQKQIFLTRAERSNFASKSDSPLGKYNINQYDMNYRLLKQRQHLNKLKAMQIEVPAFNSRMKRM